jgi:hypothetical protein
MRASLVLLTTASLIGCATGPASTDSSSATLPSLEERIQFLERYVTFRRAYHDLAFHITYRNNSGGLPGPSEWDIRLVATVPPAELLAWVPAGVPAEQSAETQWLSSVPGSRHTATIREWYTSPGLIVGIDRERAVVAYRRWKH